MLDLFFLRELEEGRETGESYNSAGAHRVLALFSYLATPDDTSLLEIADRTAKALETMEYKPYLIEPQELISIYLGLVDSWEGINRAIAFWLMKHQPKEYDVTKGGSINPVVAERLLRKNKTLYNAYVERMINEHSGKIIQPVIETVS